MSYIFFAMTKQDETSSKCSNGTKFRIVPNKRYMEKGEIISLEERTVLETFTEAQFNPGISSSSLCTDTK